MTAQPHDLFDFHVGEQERHEVAFLFNVWGRLVISVDGAPIIRKLVLYSLSPVKRYTFRVGSSESHVGREVVGSGDGAGIGGLPILGGPVCDGLWPALLTRRPASGQDGWCTSPGRRPKRSTLQDG